MAPTRQASTATTSTITYALVGKTGHGKSTSANNLSSSEAFVSSDDFDSVTDCITHREYEFDGRLFRCIDTPGLFDTKLPFPVLAARFAAFTHVSPQGLDAIVCVIRKGRMTDEEMAALCMLETMFGPDVWNHVLILFTHCSDEVTALKARISKLNDGHLLKSVCAQASFRVAKIENLAGSEQIELDRSVIHRMIEAIRIDTGKRYDNEYFQFARQKILEVDKAASKLEAEYATRIKSLQSDWYQGRLSKDQFDAKVSELEVEINTFRAKKKEIELEHLQRSLENWDNFKDKAMTAGLVVAGTLAAAGAAVVVTPYLITLGLATGFAGLAVTAAAHKLGGILNYDDEEAW